ncbi:unnamed protein product [Peniophora sp. CBMAI 1063]|nr:unnamed protein product [Peniophora sp. CBMAI 1063]
MVEPFNDLPRILPKSCSAMLVAKYGDGQLEGQIRDFLGEKSKDERVRTGIARLVDLAYALAQALDTARIMFLVLIEVRSLEDTDPSDSRLRDVKHTVLEVFREVMAGLAPEDNDEIRNAAWGSALQHFTEDVVLYRGEIGKHTWWKDLEVPPSAKPPIPPLNSGSEDVSVQKADAAQSVPPATTVAPPVGVANEKSSGVQLPDLNNVPPPSAPLPAVEETSNALSVNAPSPPSATGETGRTALAPLRTPALDSPTPEESSFYRAMAAVAAAAESATTSEARPSPPPFDAAATTAQNTANTPLGSGEQAVPGAVHPGVAKSPIASTITPVAQVHQDRQPAFQDIPNASRGYEDAINHHMEVSGNAAEVKPGMPPRDTVDTPASDHEGVDHDDEHEEESSSSDKWKIRGLCSFTAYDPEAALRALPPGQFMDDLHLSAFPEFSGIRREWSAHYRVACENCTVKLSKCMFMPPKSWDGKYISRACGCCARFQKRCSGKSRVSPEQLREEIIFDIPDNELPDGFVREGDPPPPNMAVRIAFIEKQIEDGHYPRWPVYLEPSGWFIKGIRAPKFDPSTLHQAQLYTETDYPFLTQTRNTSRKRKRKVGQGSPSDDEAGPVKRPKPDGRTSGSVATKGYPTKRPPNAVSRKAFIAQLENALRTTMMQMILDGVTSFQQHSSSGGHPKDLASLRRVQFKRDS